MSKFGACVDNTLTWIGNNKLLTFFILLAFSLMVSTWALADTGHRLRGEINYMKEHWSPPVETTPVTTPEPPVTTPEPGITTVQPPPPPPEDTTISTEDPTGTRRRRRFA